MKRFISVILCLSILLCIVAVGVTAKENSDDVLIAISTDKSSYSASDTANVTVRVNNKSGKALNGVVIAAKADNWLLAKGSNSNVLQVGDMKIGEIKKLSFDCVVNRNAQGLGFFSIIILFFKQLFNQPSSFENVNFSDKSSTSVHASLKHGGATVNILATVWYVPADDEPDVTEPPVNDDKHIEFGSYPQSQVKDSSLVATLNAQYGTWQSYNYYTGTGNWADGRMKASDYMRYKDVTYNGNKYRAVIFDSYRPCSTELVSDKGTGYQYENGYVTGCVYWFKYEPIKWRVLDRSKGLVMCDTIIDSQAYNNYIAGRGKDGHDNDAFWGNSTYTYYANDWSQSSLRSWLNSDFYNTAFSSSEKSNIITSTNSNKGEGTLKGFIGYEEYDSIDTNDRVFLLSYDELINSSYGFNSDYSLRDKARSLKGSDYAKCQGLEVWKAIPSWSLSIYNGYSYWWLRTPSYYTEDSCNVNPFGEIWFVDVNNASYGVCPALKLNLSSIAS